MRTLGIDLAAQPTDTAVCEIVWMSERAFPEVPRRGVGDAELLGLMATADWVGIDAPFGWPDAMVDAIHAFAHGDLWPASAVPEKLRYRLTDWFVHEIVTQQRDTSIWPLSVSSDRIAVCAWRCANLLSRHAEQTSWNFDRIGVPLSAAMDGPPDTPRPTGLVAENGVVEVYPAGALALWAYPHKGYKPSSTTPGAVARQKRQNIMALIERDPGGWLFLPDEVREACVSNDDQLDAFIASLVACAAATGATLKPRVDQRGAAQREGWIHLPSSDSILSLAPGAV